MKKAYFVTLLVFGLSLVFALGTAQSGTINFDLYKGYSAHAEITDRGGNVLASQDSPASEFPQGATASAGSVQAQACWYDSLSLYTESHNVCTAGRNALAQGYQEFDFTPTSPTLHVQFDYDVRLTAALAEGHTEWDWAYACSILQLGVNGSKIGEWAPAPVWVDDASGNNPYSRSLSGSFDEYFSLTGIPIGSVCFYLDTFASGQNASTYAGIDLKNVKIEYAPVPVPGTLWLFGSALAGLGGLRRKLRKR
ncbi:MAG: PEP-CTERM sorting domain-containing protein [Pseudomonadota bacterium]